MKNIYGFKKGINLGGWFSQCEYTYEHFENFIKDTDFAVISFWGLDHIRLPVDSGAFTKPDGTYDEYVLELIDKAIDDALKYNLRVVLDLHKTEGFAFDGSVGENNLLTNEELIEKFLSIWEMLSKRYSRYGHNIMFEPLNEIDRQDSSLWNMLVFRTIYTIRKYAPRTKILVGGTQWNSPHTLHLLDKPYDENVVYNFHFYEPFLFTHQMAEWQPIIPQDKQMLYPDDIEEYRRLSHEINCFGSGLYNDGVTKMGAEFMEALIINAVKAAEENGAALYCGEYGVIDNAPAQDTLRWYKDINSVFEKYGISRAAWTYKDLNFGLCGKHYQEVINELVKYL